MSILTLWLLFLLFLGGRFEAPLEGIVHLMDLRVGLSGLLASEVVFAGDPTFLARDNIF